jgi:hypothetical protein
MGNLIADLRQRGEAGSAEYVLSGHTYWSDEDLQTRLDHTRTDVFRAPLTVGPVTSGGSAVYQDYYWRTGDAVEEASSGTVAWRVEDSAGSVIGTADYTVNYAARHIRFAANTAGSAYFLSYRAFDLDRAEAEVWERKAANVANRFDVSTDNHMLTRSQLQAHYLAMAASARRRAPAQVRTRIRDDVG